MKDDREDIDMNAITTRAGQDIQDMAKVLAAYPTPDKWTPEQKTQAVQFAALLDTAQKMITAAGLAGIDYAAEKETFLNNAGKTDSLHTRSGYRAALGRLETWANREGINILELTPARADDFIYSLRGRAPASIRLDAAAVSSFFTFMERRHASIKNPFRGTKARPGKKAVKKTEIPTTAELKSILAALPPHEKAAATVMAYRGLRAGALPPMTIKGAKFETRSKGKEISGELPPLVLQAIEDADLPLRSPFAGILPNTLEKRIARRIEKLCNTGKIAAAYSCHDLRHYFATQDYQKHKDIHRLSKLLGHASIQVTETYLRGLGEIDL
jgi:integrase